MGPHPSGLPHPSLALSSGSGLLALSGALGAQLAAKDERAHLEAAAAAAAAAEHHRGTAAAHFSFQLVQRKTRESPDELTSWTTSRWVKHQNALYELRWLPFALEFWQGAAADRNTPRRYFPTESSAAARCIVMACSLTFVSLCVCLSVLLSSDWMCFCMEWTDREAGPVSTIYYAVTCILFVDVFSLFTISFTADTFSSMSA